jgi:hypothetical protein
MRSKKRAPGGSAEPAPGDRADGVVPVDDGVEDDAGAADSGAEGSGAEGSGAKGSFVVMSPLWSSVAPGGSGGDPDCTLTVP